jgi:hypothetical protein
MRSAACIGLLGLVGCLGRYGEPPAAISAGLGYIRSLAPTPRATLLAATETGLHEVDAAGRFVTLWPEPSRAVSGHPDRVYVLADEALHMPIQALHVHTVLFLHADQLLTELVHREHDARVLVVLERRIASVAPLRLWNLVRHQDRRAGAIECLLVTFLLREPRLLLVPSLLLAFALRGADDRILPFGHIAILIQSAEE